MNTMCVYVFVLVCISKIIFFSEFFCCLDISLRTSKAKIVSEVKVGTLAAGRFKSILHVHI